MKMNFQHYRQIWSISATSILKGWQIKFLFMLQMLQIKFDVSKDCQGKVLDILNEDIQKIESVCNKYKQPVPKLMKLMYEPKTKKFNAEYTYENQTSDDVSVFDNYDAWFEEKKRRLEKIRGR